MKRTRFLIIPLFALLIGSIVVAFSAAKSSDHGKIKWVSFGEAVELSKKQPKMIFVDVFTTWCGPCKMLSANTFGNEHIAKYMNENFYCVKFDAETRDTVKFSVAVPDTIRDKKGAVKKIATKQKEFVYYNTNPPGTPRATHQFAFSILSGYQVAYPSMIFVSKDIKRVNVVQGYLNPQQFEPVVKYYGSGAWEKMTWDEYQKTFKSELGAN